MQQKKHTGFDKIAKKLHSTCNTKRNKVYTEQEQSIQCKLAGKYMTLITHTQPIKKQQWRWA